MAFGWTAIRFHCIFAFIDHRIHGNKPGSITLGLLLDHAKLTKTCTVLLDNKLMPAQKTRYNASIEKCHRYLHPYSYWRVNSLAILHHARAGPEFSNFEKIIKKSLF
jgi:hypothetical protein